MTEAPKTVKEKMEAMVPPAVTQIPFFLVEKHHNKTTRLLANSGKTAPIEGQNRWHSYEFKEAVFISRVVVNETGYADYKTFEVKVLDTDGNEHLSSARPQTGKVVLDVNRFCTVVEFKPPKAYLADPAIQSIEVFGFRRQEVGKFVQFAREIDAFKATAIADIEKREATYHATIERATKAEAQRADALKEVANLKSQADRQRAAIRRLESERADLTTKVSVLGDNLSKNTRERDATLRELESRSEEKEDIEAQIAKLQRQLSELKANIDLFPSELDSFVKQGARNNKTFFWLAAAPIVVICAMFILLTSGAVDLTTKITESQEINLTALIVSRMPYVIVSLAIITACYKIARSFISEMMHVNRQRLNLTKVSIIAKDVSTAAEHGLDLSETDRYNLRVRLKMDLLKDHLKGYISPNLEVLPNTITQYFPLLPSNKRGSRDEGEGPSEVTPAAD